MEPVRREDLLDYQTYTERRPEISASALQAKKPRRVHVGEHLTFLFENTETTRYQIQEMMRVERIVKESAIQHELDTYNGLLGGPGELGCALLIEVADEAERKPKLKAWIGLEKHLYVTLEDGSRVYATFDPEQVGDERLSAVQYLKFDTKGKVPVAVGTDFPPLEAETRLTPEQQQALENDLRA